MTKQGPEVYNVEAGSAYTVKLSPSKDKKCTQRHQLCMQTPGNR